jgi:hypothetical protein
VKARRPRTEPESRAGRDVDDLDTLLRVAPRREPAVAREEDVPVAAPAPEPGVLPGREVVAVKVASLGGLVDDPALKPPRRRKRKRVVGRLPRPRSRRARAGEDGEGDDGAEAAHAESVAAGRACGTCVANQPAGYATGMADPLKEPKQAVQDVVAEADRGRSERTPFLALSGVTLLVGAAAAIVILIAFLVYYLA